MTIGYWTKRNLASKSLGGLSLPPPAAWVRNPSWITLTAPITTDHKFVGVHAVYPEGAFLALSAAGAYNVDWGDGTNENVATGVVALHLYDYTDADLANTNGPVTFTDAGDVVNRVAHGYTDGMKVQFYNIVSTTGLTEGYTYYVVNKTPDTFQVSLTSGGAAVVLTTNGTGTLLPYKQALVTLTMQAGESFTALNLHVKHTQTNLQAYSSGFLDIAIAGALLTDIRIGVATPGATTQTIGFSDLERVNIVRSNLKNAGYLFYTGYSLQSIVDVATSTDAETSFNATLQDAGDTVTSVAHGRQNNDPVLFTSITTTTGITVGTQYYVINKGDDTFQVSTTYGGSAATLTTNGSCTVLAGTDFTSMFNACRSLTSIPLFNTAAGITFTSMFSSCASLTSIPLFNTAAGITFTSMFNACYSLASVPLFNTAAGVTFTSMFNSCYSLTSIPLFNTAAGVTFTSMFNACVSLASVPLFNTAAGVTFTSMFNACYSLTSIPLFNTAAGITFTSMFNSCYSLTSISLFNTAAGVTFTSMFNACRSLTSIPLFNTAAGITFTSMFSSCVSLTSIPLFNTAAGITFTSMFNACYSLASVPLFNTAAGVTFTDMFNSCYSLTSIPLFNTAAGVTFTDMFSNCVSLYKGTLSGTKATIAYTSCKLSKTALEAIFDALGLGTSQTITVSTNYGAVTPVALSGATVAGSTTVLMATTTGIVVGDTMTGTGMPLTTGIAVTFQDAGDTVTLTAHGLSNADPVMFSVITTTTGIVVNTIYYAVGVAANTFQVEATVGGGALPLTTNGTGTLKYVSKVVTINTGVSVVMDRPAVSTGTNTLSYRALQIGKAMLKGWTVTGG